MVRSGAHARSACAGKVGGVTLTVADYARAKRLPEAFLRDLGLREADWFGTPAIAIPYVDQDGDELAVRYRVAMNGADPFRWERGTNAKGLVYGLDHWRKSAAAGYALLVEGESDAMTAWLHDVAAFGLPGAGMFEDDLTSPCLEGIGQLYAVQEPGEAGKRFIDVLRQSRLSDRVRVIRLDEHKDLSELHLAVDGDRDRFLPALKVAIDQGEPLATVAASTEETPPHSWHPVDLLAIEADPPPPPTISGLAYPGRRHVYSGEPETLKTWAALVLGVEEIRAGRGVVYIDFEMGDRTMLERLRALGLEDEEIRERFAYLTPSEPMTDPQVLVDMGALLTERQASLVIFDAFTGALEIHGCDPNSGVEVERFYRTVVGPLQTRGVAVVLLDHPTKAKETRGKFSIGSERKIAACDVHLGFEIVRPFGRGRDGLAKLTTHKDRPGYLARPKAAELELSSDPDTGLISWEIRPAEHSDDQHPFRPTHLMEKVSLYVGAQLAEPPSRNRVEENVTGKRDFVRLAIDTLLAEGYLAEEDGLRNARLLRFVKPYREADDAL
jgi:AAA domain